MQATENFPIVVKNGVYIKEEIIIESDDSLELEIDTRVSDNKEEALTQTATTKIQRTNVNQKKKKRPKTNLKRPGTYSSQIILRCPKCEKIKVRKRGELQPKCLECGVFLRHECINCGKQYGRRERAYNHVRLYCLKSIILKCSECSFSTSQERYLRLHCYSVHTIANPENYNKCSKCDRRYKHKKDMLKHERICGLKPYLRCAHCKYKTNNNRYLRLHMMKKHTAIKPEDYTKCPMCEATFKFKMYLTTHMRKVHKKDKKLSCAHCHFKSYEKSKLLNHIQKNHYPDLFSM